MQQLENGTVNCGEDEDVKFSFGSRCIFNCAKGHRLLGSSTMTCTSTAEWSEEMPQCEGEDALLMPEPNQYQLLFFLCTHPKNTFPFLMFLSLSLDSLAISCSKPKDEAHLLAHCSGSFRPDSTCSFSCDSGFELQGAAVIQCSEAGTWNTNTPTCKGKMCNKSQL